MEAMETDNPSVQQQEEEEGPPKKKVKRFLGKEFRKKLSTDEKLPALQNFLELCKGGNLDPVFYYLESGGNSLELFKLLETGDVPASLIVEILQCVLLEIVGKYPQHKSAADGACRYFLNTHLTLINNMMSLSSSATEKKLILRLLTVIVTLSNELAKQILFHVYFNEPNLEVMSNHKVKRENVRNAFVHFVIAFLVEGDPTIMTLVNKKGLLGFIMKGTLNDSVEIVSIIMASLKNHILKNPRVSKTNKMKIFNTVIIKEIVNLYNWMGPVAFDKKNKVQIVKVNENHKSQVNKAVHDILLVLCTSHSDGIIFKDHNVGLSSKTSNNLMLSVLDSMEKPWEHSYASELTRKICKACPDLVKTVWNKLKPFLEPRTTSTWLSAIKFSSSLVKELDPTTIEFCVKDLSVQKLFQVIQTLVAPTSILKTIVLDNFTYEDLLVKHNVLILLVDMTTSIQNYLNAAKNWLNLTDFNTFRNLINEHLCKYFPNSLAIFKDWKISEGEVGSCSLLDHVGLILNQLSIYQYIFPQLLENFDTINLESFLEDLNELPDQENATAIQIQAIKLFISLEPSLFAPNKKLFEVATSLVLNCYYKSRNPNDRETLIALLESTGIFDGCREEICVWIDAIFDSELSLVLVEIVKETSENLFQYLNDLMELSLSMEMDEEPQMLETILQNLENGVSNEFVVRHQNLTPTLLGAMEYLTTAGCSKEVKNYLNSVVIRLFHSQTNLNLITEIILNEKFRKFISKSVAKYVKVWGRDQALMVLPENGLLLNQTFSSHFLEGKLSDFVTKLKEMEDYSEQLPCLLQQALFYVTHNSQISKNHLKNFEEFVTFLVSEGTNKNDLIKKILCTPNILKTFKSTIDEKEGQANFNNLLVRIVEQFQDLNLVEVLKPYRWELYKCLTSMLEKPKNIGDRYMQALKILEVFQLGCDECINIINCCAKTVLDISNTDFLLFYYRLLTTTLKIYLNSNPPPADIIQPITQFLVLLNKECPSFDSGILAHLVIDYFKMFPHSLKATSLELFESILYKTEFCKENALLANFLLTRRTDFLSLFIDNIDNFSKTKGLMLSLISATVSLSPSDDVLEKVYQSFEFSILKCLEKPHKAGRYFAIYSKDVSFLISKCMSVESCLPFVRKIQKFETTEPFHLEMLISIFLKSMQDNSDYLNNSILTLTHFANSLFKRKTKSDEDWTKLDEIIELSNGFYNEISNKELKGENSFKSLRENEAFQLYYKFCLKFGLSGRAPLIKLVKNLIKLVNFEEAEARLLFNMMSSHSEFLEILLEKEGDLKMELLNLFLNLCERWTVLMQKNHVPILLASYEATIKPSDRIILTLLQMYEKESSQTHFYDFKPFIWGHSAIAHYSIRHDIQTALFRQPKMGEILDNLQEDRMLNTICNYSLKSTLTAKNNDVNEDPQNDVYDLTFLFTLFNFLLSPENETAPYRFIPCGGLSMTIVALSSNDARTRKAACHILRRFSHEIEAKGNKKNNFFWVRFIEALCESYSALDNAQLNNFAAIFWARMALILFQPSNVMYIPLTQYLGTKETLVLNSIPELYTFLHFSDVNFREVRTFILEVIRDGLRSEEDFSVALHAMTFKLIMELFSSCVAGLNTKIRILSIIHRACNLKIGRNILCSRHGLLSWLYEIVANLQYKDEGLLSPLIDILLAITEDLKNVQGVNLNQVYIILTTMINKNEASWLSQSDLKKFLNIIINVMKENCKFLNEKHLDKIMSLTDNTRVRYYFQFQCGLESCKEKCDTVDDFVELIVIKWINK